MREIVSLAEEAALAHLQFAHAPVRCVNAAHTVVRTARAVSDHAILERFRRDALQQGDFGPYGIDIVDRETNLRARLGSARLQFGASREDEDEVGAEGAERRPQSTL